MNDSPKRRSKPDARILRRLHRVASSVESFTRVKRCSACKRFRPSELFQKNKRVSDGLDSRCVLCYRPIRKQRGSTAVRANAEWFEQNNQYVSERNALVYARKKILRRMDAGVAYANDPAKLREIELELGKLRLVYGIGVRSRPCTPGTGQPPPSGAALP